MKKFTVAPHTAKRMKAIIAAAMALTMAVPTSVYFSSKEAKTVNAEASVEVPAPIMSVDFEKGFVGENATNGLEVVKSEEVQEFDHLTAADGKSYLVDDNGNDIYQMTDTPTIQNDAYKKKVVGNQPVTGYDPEHKSVLFFDDTVKIPKFTKKVADKMESVPVGTVLQNEVTAESVVTMNNPFAGKELKDANEYGAGVSISYWVKVPANKDGSAVSNASLITFNNTKRQVTQRDDLAKHNACVAYDEALAKNDTETLKDYSLGTQKTVKDAAGTEYTLYENYGKLIRLNPDYPGHGWYAPTKASDAKIDVTDADGKTYKIASLGMGTADDANQYQYFRYYYAKDGNETNGYSTQSKIRSEVIKGSMSITVNDDFGFREDAYRPITLSDGSIVPTDGAVVTNPNLEPKMQDFGSSNQFFFSGDKTVTKNADQWHYITFVIQNDWVKVYADGKYLDPEESFSYCDGLGAFNQQNYEKSFNQGNGLRAPFDNKEKTDWSANGTLAAGPGNALQITMLDWLTDKDTELFLGANGVASYQLGQSVGTYYGVMLDGLKFYDVPLTDEQAVKAYNDAVAATKKDTTTVPDPIAKFTFDDNSMNSTDSSYSMSPNSTNIAGKDPSVASDSTRGNVLKLETGKTSGTSAVKLSKNPFAGKDLTGATVSYWMKMSDAANSPTATFADEAKEKTHPKITGDNYGSKSSTILKVNSTMTALYEEGYTNGVYTNLKNHFEFSQKKNAFTNQETDGKKYDPDAVEKLKIYQATVASTTEWHYVTAVFNNYEIQLYMDGVKLNNNLQAKDGTNASYGTRFFDGYYDKVNDGFSRDYYPSNNQGATPIMTFLTDATTSAYFGFANTLGSSTLFEKTTESYFDDIAYYDVALTDSQVDALYKAQGTVTPGPGTETQAPVNPEDPGKGGATPADQTSEVVLTVNSDGSMSSSFGGVTFNAPTGVISADDKLTLGKLGTEDSASVYSAFTTTLNGIKDFTTKDFVVYTAIAKDPSGNAVAANGKFTLTFDIPAGYDANSVVVVGEDGTVYSGTVSADGKTITIETSKFGNYAVVQKDMSTDDGSTIAGGASKSGKTGDTANVVIPFAILAIAGATLVVSYKKKAFEK